MQQRSKAFTLVNTGLMEQVFSQNDSLKLYK